MQIPEFPSKLLWEARHNWRLAGGLTTAGRAGLGMMPAIRIDGGGLWKATLSDIMIYDREEVNLWRAVRNLANGGVAPLIVTRIDDGSAPWPIIDGVEVRSAGDIPHDDDTPHDDDAGYSQNMISSVVVNATNLRATSLRLVIGYGGALIGGEAFSIQHTTMDWRMYEIATATDVGNGVYDVTFLPPLREDTLAGTLIEFDRPRCVMRLERPDSMDHEMQVPWYSRPSVSFIEYGLLA